MFCHKCGEKNQDDAVYCISCGDQLKKADLNSDESKVNLEKKIDSVESTNQDFFAQAQISNQNQNGFQDQSGFQNSNNVKQVRSPLVWAILVTVFGAFTCCCLNPVSLVVGIIAIVFSSGVDDKQRRGDIEGAKADAKKAIILSWVGLGFIILTVVIVAFLMILGAISPDNYQSRL